MSLAEQTEDIVRFDIDPDFIKSICISIGWAYSDLFDELNSLEGADDGYLQEEFANRRGNSVVRALLQTAKQHGVPFEFWRLPCNGQNKLIVKLGRVVLIQEPILPLDDDPRAAEYKQELADSHGLIRQLELDLGDRPIRNLDWSGCVLAVLLHGAAGIRFTHEHKKLGALMLAVPDAAYSHWVLRLDLHSVAMEGRGFEDTEIVQKDSVNVTLKRRNVERENGA